MQSALVDSSFFLRQQRYGGVDVFGALRPWCRQYELVTCGMVRLEVERGTRSLPILHSYMALFDAMRNVPTLDRVWGLATDIARALEKKGTPVPAPVSIIAAHALDYGAAVITVDTDFRRIPALTVLHRLS